MNYNDYLNHGVTSRRSSKVRVHRHAIHAALLGSTIAALFVLLGTSNDAEATREATPRTQAGITLTETLPLPTLTDSQEEPSLADPLSLPTDSELHRVTVKSGDSMFLIFKRAGVDLTDLHRMMSQQPEAKRLRQIQPGDKLDIYTDGGQLKALHYTIDVDKKLVINRRDGGFDLDIIEEPVEVRLTSASGTINSSLYGSATEAGLSDNLIMELAAIFGWDIDFALDLRKGDSFSVVFEEQYLDGEKLRDGAILAAEFINRGQHYQAVRYTDPNGKTSYYSPDGRSMRKAFLRSPVDFRRISSRFQPERYHPVLGKKRPHRGVDYAASSGTPIKAAGDGKVIFRGTKGGYGRTVIIQHGSRYTTLYAHMSSFRRGVGNGTRVKQGQIIGYVGMSGLATGPHLHYEFRVDGVHRNPLTVKLPDSKPVPKAYRADFEQQATLRLAQLDSFKRLKLALNQ